MRRILITLVMSGAVLVAAPGGALAAHHHARHHARHSARHHARHHSRRRHHRVQHRRFEGDQPGNSTGQAGTVTSFQNGVLTITLNDGSMVSGAVTDQTELECMAPDNDQQGEDNDRGDNGDQSGDRGDDNGGSGDDNGDRGDDNGDNDGNDNAQMCGTSSLTPGTPVAEANLEISGSGATWNKVELVTSSS